MRLPTFFLLLALHAEAAPTGGVTGTIPLPARPRGRIAVEKYTGTISGKVSPPPPPRAGVWIEGTGTAAPAAPPKIALTQQGYQFAQSLLVVPLRTTVEFPNDDPDFHNVFSLSRTKRFDAGRYKKSERPAPTATFDKAGLVRLQCEIHDHMKAVILVVDSRYFTTTDADGKFTSAKAWTNWSGKPLGDITLRVAVSGQIASEPLLSSEEMGLGGAYLGRAFEFYERSGDQGIMGSLELGYEFSKPVSWIKRLQPFAFVDGGYVGNLQGGYGGGTLISAGGGLRADIGPVGVQVETALPVYLSGDGSGNSSPKVNVQVGLEF